MFEIKNLSSKCLHSMQHFIRFIFRQLFFTYKHKIKSSDLDRTVCKSLPVYIHKLGIEYKDEVGKNDVIKNTISVTQKAPICKNTY